jgi:lysophospholipase L1-like esterase
MSRLPETIGGHPVVNGGIGGATISDFERIASDVIGDARPSMIAVSLGTNDSGSDNIERDYRALLARLKKIAPKLLAVAVTRQDGSDAINAQIKSAAGSEGVPFIEEPLPAGSTLADHIHLNAAGYSKWTPALVAAIEAL